MKLHLFKMSETLQQFLSQFVASQLIEPKTHVVESSPNGSVYLGLSNTQICDWNVSALRSISHDHAYLFAQFQVERQLDPALTLEYVQKHFKSGFIRFTSPLVELLSTEGTRGIPAHMHILWVADQKLHIVPKYFHSALTVQDDFAEQTKKILEEHDHYRSGYYFWNEEQPLEFKLYTYEELADNRYSQILMKGVQDYLENVNRFLSEN